MTHLCRCGHSKTKPFCDGTHVQTKFEGTEYATKEAYEQGAMYYQ
ncbi:MAG: CDGSH iron-sulfur domain-containing protein [Candidatus Peribacteria bacterium]|nr:CDGSH iron-sulfur domain-containing protein [Candidatus Peribacteria bacterium]